MATSAAAQRLVRFSGFEVDLRTAEVRQNGARVRLQEQPFQVLAILLEHPGELVTRDELRQRLWPADTFVDFDLALNTAVKKLRDALGDSAENPRFIETLPKRGYRFIAALEAAAEAQSPASAAAPRRRWFLALGVLVAAVTVAAVWWGLRSRPGLAPAGPIQSLAVLPLENLTGDPSQEYFADGITDVLITELAQVRALRVISRTSAMHYKGTRKPLPEIARELQVDAVVEGTVRRSGNRVWVNAQLVHAPTDRHLWARIYERTLAEMPLLQGQMARDIVSELKLQLTPEEHDRVGRARQVDPAAYEAYLMGRYHLGKLTEAGHLKAIDYFQRAVEMDPDYAPAYAGLAQAYVFLRQLYDPQEVEPKALAAARKALELDPMLAQAHTWMAMLAHGYREGSTPGGDLAAAAVEHRRALELNVSDPLPHVFYAQYLNVVGQHEEALVQVRRAERLDPISPFVAINVAYRLHALGRHQETLAQLRKSLEFHPDFWLTHHMIGTTYEEMGDMGQAIVAWEKAATMPGRYHWPLGALVRAYMKVGRKDDALRVLAEWERDARRRKKDPPGLARLYAVVGKHDEALQLLEQRLRKGKLKPEVLQQTEFDGMRSDPRFQDLQRRVNAPTS